MNTLGGPVGSTNAFAPGLTPLGASTPSGASDPFATMMAQLGAGGPQPGGGVPPMMMPPGMMGMGQAVAVPHQKTRFEKLLPLLHMAAVLGLLGYFVIAYEPALLGGGSWDRWAALVRSKTDTGVQPVPIFYAFMTLEIILHSMRILVEPPPQPPSGLIGMAISFLPPPIPGIISTSSKYLAMLGAVLDDLSVLLFGVGLVVWYAGWAAR